MGQMNISVTDHLAKFVRSKVKSGRFNNASEVVRDALRRMEEEEQRALRIGSPTVEDVLTDFTAFRLEAIRKRVLEGIADIEEGRFTEYKTREDLAQFTAGVKARGRRILKEAQGE
jgi:antitoxin ParD1/3/4